LRLLISINISVKRVIMEDHGLPTSFGGEAMAMSAEYSTEDGDEDAGFKVKNR
jgi:hypothetical protein